MTRWLVAAVCSLGLVTGCGDDKPNPSGTAGAGGAPGAGGAGGAGGAAGAPAVGGAGGAGGAAGAGGAGGAGGAAGAGGAVDAAGADGTGGAPADGPIADGGPLATGSMMVTAAGGGTLTAGGATLRVPAGVLATDKMITLSVQSPPADLPGRADIVGDLYEFGPDGTTFSVPVQLILPLGSAVPADKKAFIAWQEPTSGQWFPVETTVQASTVTGLVSHFTRFAVMMNDKAAMCPFAGACGGSLDGTWKYAASCLGAETKEAFQCGTAGPVNMRTEYLVGGTVTIGGGRFTANQTIEGKGTLFYTPACMTYLKDLPGGTDCAKLQEAWRMQQGTQGMVCVGTVEFGCTCAYTVGGQQTTMGAVVLSGQGVIFNEDNKPPKDKPGEFCVKGNTLTVKGGDGEVYTAVKQ